MGFSEFVGEETRNEALGLVRGRLASSKNEGERVEWERLLVGLIGRKGSGKTNGLGRLLVMAHFCSEAPDGGPCGKCETCLHINQCFDKGDGYVNVS